MASGGSKDQVSKTAFPSALDLTQHLTLVMRGQPHCRGGFLPSLEKGFKDPRKDESST